MARSPIVVSNVAVVRKDGTNDDVIDWGRATLVYEDEDGQKVLLHHEDEAAMYIPRGAWTTCPIKDLVVDDQTTTWPAEMPEPVAPLRPYQVRPVDKMVKKGGGILEAPTGAGKTVMGLHIAARQKQRTLILVHTKDLLSQWQESARKILGIEVGIIGDGVWEEDGFPIVVAMVQTLMRYEHFPEEWLDQWGMVLLDEAHRCPASSFARVMGGMSTRLRYGVTATPTRRDGKHPLMHAIIGPLSARVKEDVLVDEGNLIRPAVTMVATQLHSLSGNKMTRARNQYQRQALYQRTIVDLAEDNARNHLIARHVGKHSDGHQLVLSDRIQHLYDIEKAIYDVNPSLRTFVVTGKHKTREREEALQAMRDGGLDVLLATQLADEGLDIVNLDVLHLTFPSRATQKLQQKVGRIMRSADGKRAAHVYDYADIKIPVLRGQAKVRYEWYESRGCVLSGWSPVTDASIRSRLAQLKQEGKT